MGFAKILRSWFGVGLVDGWVDSGNENGWEGFCLAWLSINETNINGVHPVKTLALVTENG